MIRRLAAILAADVVGYSAMMVKDEVGTLESLRRLRRELFHPSVAGNRGKVVKNLGDGWLVEFASSVDAVNCSLQLQAGLENDPEIKVRIGVHLGDITHEDEDVYGDGVNVAARLEAIAEPGAVVISDAVHGTLDETLAPSFDLAGEQSLKNLLRPVRVWIRRPGVGNIDRANEPIATDQRAGYPVVIAITPMFTSDPRSEIRELAAALTNDLFNYLDNGRWMTSVVTERPPQQAYILTTMLRASGERLQINASMSGPNAELIWSRRLDGALGSIFDWQDEAGREIATSVGSAILEDVRNALACMADEERTAANCLLTAMTGPILSPEQAITSFAAIERAIALDPEWALPYAWGSHQITFLVRGGPGSAHALYADRYDEWYELGRRTSDGDIISDLLLAAAKNNREDATQSLMLAVDNVLKRRPFHQMALWIGTMACAYAGKPTLAISYSKRLLAYNVDPSLWATTNSLMANALLQLGQDGDALELAQKVVAARPDAPLYLRTMVAALACRGLLDEARAECTKMLKLAPGMTVLEAKRLFRGDTQGIRRYLDGLRIAGLPEGDGT